MNLACCPGHVKEIELEQDFGRIVNDIDYILDKLRVPVSKALNPLKQRDFVRWEAKVARKLKGAFRETGADEVKKVTSLIRQVDLARPETIERFVKQVSDELKGLERGVAKKVVPVLEVAIEDMYKASKVAAVDLMYARKLVDSKDQLKVFGSRDERAVELLNKHQHSFIKDGFADQIGTFNGRVRGVLSQGIEEGWTRDRITEKLMKSFGATVADESYWNVVSSAWMNRTRNWANLETMSQADIAEYEVLEMMDERTCPICKAMDGKRFSVKKQLSVLEKASESSSLDEMKTASPWLTTRIVEGETHVGLVKPSGRFVTFYEADKQVASPSDMQRAGAAMPPFHGLCRGTVVAV